jgi:hypothetical protein
MPPWDSARRIFEMTTTAFKGSQTLLKIGDGVSPEVFTTIGEVTSIGALGQRNDLIEVTHLESTAKEYIGGLPDGLEIAVVCNYKPTHAQQVAAIAAVTAGTSKNFKYTMPSGGGSLTFSFTALVLGWTVGPTTPNEAVHLELTLKISGSITGPV